MLYLAGLGLKPEHFTVELINAIKKCNKIYIDTYTTKFDVKAFVDKIKEINQQVEIVNAERSMLEENSSIIIDEAKQANIMVAVYGNCLTATTHMTIIEQAEKQNVKVVVLHNISIIDAITEVGLSIYNFGKIVSLPKWSIGYEPCSFIKTIAQNIKNNAHTLVLVSPELNLNQALQVLRQALEKAYKENTIDKEEYNYIMNSQLIIASKLASEKKQIFTIKLSNIKEIEIDHPFCIIVPAKLQFFEQQKINKLKAIK